MTEQERGLRICDPCWDARNVPVDLHRYRFGWVCERCDSTVRSTRPDCKHIKAAKEAI